MLDLLDLIEQREKLKRAHAVFTRVHTFITERGPFGKLTHLRPDDVSPSETENPKGYSEGYWTENRGWVSLKWHLEPVTTDAVDSISHMVEVVLSVEDFDREDNETWEGASLGIIWTEVDGWSAEHYICEGGHPHSRRSCGKPRTDR